MKENVLIVEDEFIVANDLRFKLLKAGYTVCGIAATVREAKELIEQTKPTWVLLDIFLQDGSMGTDLATYLREKNIGFIYISANTNQSVLEKAKATQPYAFLVKPFRERDLLIMLDIASQKHQNNLQLNIQKELVWKGKLQNIIDAPVDIETKIARIPGAFRTFVPFDYMKIDLLNKRENGTIQFSFVRIGFDEYQIFKGVEIQAAMGLSSQDISRFKLRFPENRGDELLNGIDYKKSLMEDLWEKQLSNFYSLGSKMLKRIPLPNLETVFITFYSRNETSYSSDQLSLLEKTENELAQLFTQLKEPAPRPQAAQPGFRNPSKSPSGNNTEETGFDGIIGKSPGLLRVLDRINMVAGSTTSVLITGESGTGKERVAQCLHKLSKRKLKPLVVVNCAALPFELVESELFGHEKGAFTGAIERRLGKFETADGGTIFLDEIGELPLEAQVKLLRVTQEMEFERVGSSKTTKVDVRIIAATNKNLEMEVSQGRFRLDLYYRLNVFPIELPPLRERKQDIVLLAETFIERYAQRMGKQINGMSDEVITALNDYSWPGNIRELEHVIERSVLTTFGDTITEVNLHNKLWKMEETSINVRKKTLEENEADHIISVLQSCHGKVGGPGGAAEILGLPVSTLHSKMKKLGIKKGFDFDN
jgi:transcriptional regulator with GAF, ATPase, and Fis domain/AmiR/NasT family two-component response regulator